MYFLMKASELKLAADPQIAAEKAARFLGLHWHSPKKMYLLILVLWNGYGQLSLYGMGIARAESKRIEILKKMVFSQLPTWKFFYILSLFVWSCPHVLQDQGYDAFLDGKVFRADSPHLFVLSLYSA